MDGLLILKHLVFWKISIFKDMINLLPYFYSRRHAFTQTDLHLYKLICFFPWTARRSNQSILREISPQCSLEGLMLNLKLQYFGHLMWRTDSLGKNLMLGKIEGRTWIWASSRGWWWTGKLGVLQSMGSQRVRHDWATELNWSIFQDRITIPLIN